MCALSQLHEDTDLSCPVRGLGGHEEVSWPFPFGAGIRRSQTLLPEALAGGMRGQNFTRTEAEFHPDWVGCCHSGDSDNVREESLNLESGGE